VPANKHLKNTQKYPEMCENNINTLDLAIINIKLMSSINVCSLLIPYNKTQNI
jgi:hypothetical protein